MKAKIREKRWRSLIPHFSFLIFCMTLASCYSDDSSLGDPASVPTIEIGEMAEQSVVSYAGNSLVIEPEVKTAYSDDDLQYTWYLYIDKSYSDDGFRGTVIGTQKKLDYEVNLSSGVYVVTLEVKVKATGLAQYARTNLSVSTEFSDGFYILKETADGNTDLDLVTTAGGMSTDILTKLNGEPQKGAPVSLAMVYQQNYVNPDNNEMEMANMLNIFSTGDYRAYRTEDMRQIFDTKTICYAGDDNDDVYYNITNGYNMGIMMSKKGVSSIGMKGTASLSTGKFTLPFIEDDVTKHVQMCGGGQSGYAYWSNSKHSVCNIDQACINVTVLTTDSTQSQTCLASGLTRKGGVETVWFLTEEPGTGKRFLHMIDGKLAQPLKIRELRPELHLSKATTVGACGGSASYIYAIDGRKLYAYGFESDTEVEVPLPGVTEPVDLVTNQWLSLMFGDKQLNYDHLIVGSQNGDTYKLWFFDNLVGGMPTVEAYRTVTGTGKARYIRRCTPSVISNMVITMGPRAPMPIFPTSE